MSEQPRRLTVTEIHDALKELPGWNVVAEKLHRDYKFPGFVEAFGFMSSVALIAEAMNHHPDWSNGYNKVVVDLITHSLGGISTLDLALARKMEILAAKTAV
ncbi:MAG: 4a-hydroxytetrahydrobiopterin dehydratase [Acidobacteria bacterium]|nr:4a-hydroxytetrahydrobiopterin dehydratase [Acidobacteriota bacterium]